MVRVQHIRKSKEASMSEQQRHEKEEKEEKHEEKSREEKWRRDPLGGMVWASILIWAGLVLLADNLKLLARFERLEAWAIILIGAGLILLLEVAVRLLVPAYRRAVTGTLILGLVLIGAGLGDLLTWNVIGPVILIVLGVFILFRVMIRRG
jgi:hypothetical protein